MKLSGITKETASPEGGEIIRDAEGDATGVFVDNAMELIKVPEPDMEQQNKALDLAFEELSRKGITRFHDAGATRATVALLEERAKAGTLPRPPPHHAERLRHHAAPSANRALDPDGLLVDPRGQALRRRRHGLARRGAARTLRRRPEELRASS